MSKLPWMKLWFEDLDRDCGALSLAARGAWMWIIGDLYNKGGERSLTLEQWSRVIRSSVNQTASVLSELIVSNTCDSNIENVTRDALSQNSDALIAIKCRRIYRETKERQQHAARQSKYRSKSKEANHQSGSTEQRTPSSDAKSDACVTPIEAEAKKQKHNKKQAAGANRADPRFIPLRDYFFEQYQKNRKRKFLPSGADFNGLRALLREHQDLDIQSLKQATDRFFASDDPYHLKQGRALHFFCMEINAFLVDGLKTKKSGSPPADMRVGESTEAFQPLTDEQRAEVLRLEEEAKKRWEARRPRKGAS
jgi:hypothetical protein